MSKIICDVMDCKHIEPIERLLGGGPFIGECKAALVNIYGGVRHKRCITYDRRNEDEGKRVPQGSQQ